MLRKILALKDRRLEQAGHELTRCRFALAEANRRHAETNAALTHHRQQSLAEERRQYAELLGKPVKRRELDGLRDFVAMLRAKEREIEAMLAACLTQQQQAADALQQATANYRHANAEKEKFGELVNRQAEYLAKEQEQAQDRELDDLAEFRQRQEADDDN